MHRKICVVGVGQWGLNHARALRDLGCLAGIVEPRAERAAEIQPNFPDVSHFKTVREALAAEFDGFTVATPAETHFAVAQEILAAGKPALVEKPLALTAADARRLTRLAGERRLTLMVGHVLLFHPAIRKIKELITQGKIGRLQYMYSNRLNLGTVRSEENILWSFAPHDIAIFQYLTESTPIEVTSRGGVFLQPEIHDSTVTVLRYPGNIVGHIFVSWLHPFKEQRLVVIGSKGMLSFEDSSDAKDVLFYEKGIDWVKGEPVRRDGPTAIIEYQRAMPLNCELEYFVEHLDSGGVEIANGQNGVEVLQVLEQATQGLLGGQAAAPEAPAPPEQKDYYVHPTSFVDDNVEIGEGTKIWHYSHVQSGAHIGRKCSLGQNVNVGNNAKIGNFCKIQNNVSIYEGVELEDYVFCGPSMVFTNVLDPRCKYPQRGSGHYVPTLIKEGASIGANATIVCGHTVGRHAFIGAGATVVTDVPDYALMLGVPARRKGWMCECGEILPAFERDIACPRCKLQYRLEQNRLVPAS